MKTSLVLLSLLVLAGCSASSRDFIKSVESRAYDVQADIFSKYCEKTADSSVLLQERLESRREIRQRGTHGPWVPPVSSLGLDEKTAEGRGPVVRVWCAGDTVPDEVWTDFIRD